MKKVFVLVATLILTTGWMLIAVPQAIARCHFFTVSASPSPVDEGGSVKVTVRRDAAAGLSNVDVETINETAVAGQDYTGIPKQTVTFTDMPNQVTKEFTVPIANDPTPEPSETFRVHLSNPGGCEPTPLVVGPDATVTIAASDAAAPPPPAATSPPAKKSPSPSASPSPSPSPGATAAEEIEESPSLSESPSPTASPSPRTLAEQEEESGRSVWPIVGLVALVVAAGAGGGWWWLKRRAA